MKRKISFNLNEKALESFLLLKEKYNEKEVGILEQAIYFENELNEEDKNDLDIFLDEMYSLGWYPFVSNIYSNKNSFEEINEIKKDEYIFELLQLEKEYTILEEFDSDIDLESIKNNIKYFKDKL